MSNDNSPFRTAFGLLLAQRGLEPRTLHSKIHGEQHWARVWRNGSELARVYEINPLIVAWFAILHDYWRKNDDRDPEHGLRAASKLPDLYQRGALTLDLTERLALIQALEFHSVGMTRGVDIAVQVCWDADRLDLGRRGVDITPDPYRLCTQHARTMIPDALRRSRGITSPF